MSWILLITSLLSTDTSDIGCTWREAEYGGTGCYTPEGVLEYLCISKADVAAFNKREEQRRLWTYLLGSE